MPAPGIHNPFRRTGLASAAPDKKNARNPEAQRLLNFTAPRAHLVVGYEAKQNEMDTIV